MLVSIKAWEMARPTSATEVSETQQAHFLHYFISTETETQASKGATKPHYAAIAPHNTAGTIFTNDQQDHLGTNLIF